MENIRTQQEKLLLSLLRQASKTAFGSSHQFSAIGSYEQYCDQIPILSYDDLVPYIEQIKSGESDILWPGTINNFAVSSGTTGKGKHLPLSKDRLKSDLRFIRKVITDYLLKYPDIGLFTGRHLSLPGTVERSPQNPQLLFGEISGFLGIHGPRWLRPLQVIDPRELAAMPWDQKFKKAIIAASNADIRVISAVPSWILVLFREVLKLTGKKSIADVWPNLKLLVCGGVSLANYRPLLEEHTRGLNLNFIENYGASEGYFAFTHNARDGMKLVTDNGIFYEFKEHSSDTIVPLWEVNTGIDYEMIVTTDAGLWRYHMNDIITFTQKDPHHIKVSGRISNMLDDYGEALHYREARQVLSDFCKDTSNSFNHLFIAPIPPRPEAPPHHEWFIDWQKAPSSLNTDQIAAIMDNAICNINRHYAIRRQTSVLGPLIINNLDSQKTLNWLSDKVLRKAQTKMPTIIRDENRRTELGLITGQ